jgi:hypothetical protein
MSSEMRGGFGKGVGWKLKEEYKGYVKNKRISPIAGTIRLCDSLINTTSV